MKIVNRIKANDDFATTIKKGKAQRDQSYVIHYCTNSLNYTRIGISVSSISDDEDSPDWSSVAVTPNRSHILFAILSNLPIMH